MKDNSSEIITILKQIGVVTSIAGIRFIVLMAIMSLNMALPTIGTDLNIRSQDLQWVISSFALSFGCFQLIGGRIADIFGRRKVYLIGVTWMTVWTLICAFAPNGIWFDIFRGLQGLGAAVGVPAGLGIMGTYFAPGPAKNRAYSCFSATAPLGLSIGLIIGGFCTATLGWRWVFYLSTIAMAFLVFIGWLCIPEDVPDPNVERSIDWLGMFLSATGLVLLTFSLSQGPSATDGWKTPYIIVLFILSIILLVLFVIWQKYIEKYQNEQKEKNKKCHCSILQMPSVPLLLMSLWNKGKYPHFMVIAFFGWGMYYNFQFYVTLYFQNYLNDSPTVTSLKFLPMVVASILNNIVVTYILSRVSSQLLMIIGLSATAISSLLFALIDPSLSYWAMAFPAMVISVLGMDYMYTITCIYVTTVVEKHEQARAGGVFQTVCQIGLAISLAIASTVVGSVTGTSTQPEDLLRGYRSGFWTAFAGACVSLIVSFSLKGLKKVGAKKKKEEVENEEEETGEEDDPTVISEEETDEEKDEESGEEDDDPTVMSEEEMDVVEVVDVAKHKKLKKNSAQTVFIPKEVRARDERIE